MMTLRDGSVCDNFKRYSVSIGGHEIKRLSGKSNRPTRLSAAALLASGGAVELNFHSQLDKRGQSTRLSCAIGEPPYNLHACWLLPILSRLPGVKTQYMRGRIVRWPNYSPDSVSRSQGAGRAGAKPTPPAAKKIKLGQLHQRRTAHFKATAHSEEPLEQHKRGAGGAQRRKLSREELAAYLAEELRPENDACCLLRFLARRYPPAIATNTAEVVVPAGPRAWGPVLSAADGAN